MTAIGTEGLSKRYGRILAHDSLSLEVRAGEAYGYPGLNGQLLGAPTWWVPANVAVAAGAAAVGRFGRRDLAGA